MPKINVLKNNFGIGELSPKLWGRSETPTFQNGAETIENYFCLLGGGVQSRPGSRFSAETKDSTKASRVIGFAASAIASYALEFGENYIRVFKDGVPVLSGSVPYEIATTYDEDELFYIDYCQENNSMYLSHPEHAPAILTCNGDTDWVLKTIPALGPFKEAGIESGVDLTLSSAAVGTGRTITAASSVFLAGDVGRKITFGDGVAYITAYTSGTEVTATIDTAFAATSITDTWTLEGSPLTEVDPDIVGPVGAVVTVTSATDTFRSTDVGKYIIGNAGVVLIDTYNSALSVSGVCKVVFSNLDSIPSGSWQLNSSLWTTSDYPQAVTLYQQRIVFGGTNSKPQTLWGSKLGSRDNFVLGSLDTDAYAFTITTDTIAPIVYLTSSKTIVAHTYLNEFTLAGDEGKALSPSSVSIEQRSQFGSTFVKPTKIGNLTVFAQRAGAKVRSFQYNYSEDAYDAPDTAAFAGHITGRGVVEMDYAQEPYSLLHVVLLDGTMGVLAYDPKQGLQGWSRYVTDGDYESVTVIPAQGNDQVWCIVKRGSKRFVEYFVSGTNTDCHVVDTDTAKATWSGLTHLNGYLVDIIADDSPQPKQTVASGEVTLTRNATSVEIGIPYTSTLKDLPVEVAGSSVGQTAQGSRMSCNEVTVRVYDTKVATIAGNVHTFRKFGTGILDQAIQPYTGDIDVHLIQGWNDRGQITITRDAPLDQTILGVYKKVTIND